MHLHDHLIGTLDKRLKDMEGVVLDKV
jgi:hypothetical protein